MRNANSKTQPLNVLKLSMKSLRDANPVPFPRLFLFC
jgi:hypothetical protein